MNYSGLCGIVRGLQLRDIDDVAAHGRRGDEAAIRKARDIALLLLPPEDVTGSAGAEEGPVEVGGNDLAIVLDLAVEGGALRPRHARVGDEDIEPVVELGDDLVHVLLDVGLIEHVDLVCLACAQS